HHPACTKLLKPTNDCKLPSFGSEPHNRIIGRCCQTRNRHASNLGEHTIQLVPREYTRDVAPDSVGAAFQRRGKVRVWMEQRFSVCVRTGTSTTQWNKTVNL